jgi:hypothetical protein
MKERGLRTLRVSDLILGMILLRPLFMQALANALDSKFVSCSKGLGLGCMDKHGKWQRP